MLIYEITYQSEIEELLSLVQCLSPSGKTIRKTNYISLFNSYASRFSMLTLAILFSPRRLFLLPEPILRV